MRGGGSGGGVVRWCGVALGFFYWFGFMEGVICMIWIFRRFGRFFFVYDTR